ncbi:glycosyltransferase [Clostridium thailandense]|uniref:glycosyltransferase n=1 Tax=Clostridium thailandense TaxID=2794346 RepID=UPI00398A1B7B
MDKNIRVLIGSPIRQEYEILDNFIDSLKYMIKENISVEYFFIDDNDDTNSSNLLYKFSKESNESVIIEQGEKIDNYIRTGDTHYWKDNLIWKIAEYKNRIIQYSIQKSYDYLFLIDSDIILHPKTLIHLIGLNKDIISEIFWTKWKSDSVELPQIWLYNEYSLVPKKSFEVLSQAESDKRYADFIDQLKKPGTYEVGGLGACTLISKTALAKGVNFNKIYNLHFWGEDRHFCIRAAALGLKLYVNTTYPAYHIYRKEDIYGVNEFRNKCKNDLTSFDKKFSTDISQFDVNAFIEDFLKNFYSYDYRCISTIQTIKYLSPQYLNRFKLKENIIKNYILEKKLVSTVNILDITTDNFRIGDSKIEATCKFQLSTNSNTENSQKNYCCRLVLNTQCNEKWFVDTIEVKNSSNKPIFGFLLLDLLEEKERINKNRDNKLTLSMLVRNESKNFLQRVLMHAAKYIDNAVILDDASEDNTVEICKEILKDIPLTIVSNKEHSFNNEIILRKQLWKMTIDTNPDWILSLDADEIFEDKILDNIKILMNQPDFDYYAFRLYDMWDENHYREDIYWQSHKCYRPFLIRYQPNFNYIWSERPLHCGRIPENIFNLNGCVCYTRLKHLGWSTPQLREAKYTRYLQLDPEGKYGILEQYKSILDENPNLIKWD